MPSIMVPRNVVNRFMARNPIVFREPFGLPCVNGTGKIRGDNGFCNRIRENAVRAAFPHSHECGYPRQKDLDFSLVSEAPPDKKRGFLNALEFVSSIFLIIPVLSGRN